MDYLPYLSCTDSEVPWLREIPPHWQLLYSKRLFQSIRKAAKPDDEQLSATQSQGVIPQKFLMETSDKRVVQALKGTDSFRHVDVDDFVISLRSFQGGIEHSAYEGCVSPAYTVLKPRKPIDTLYFRWLFKSSDYISALQTSTDSLRDGKAISYEAFGGIYIPYPTLPEQRTIAQFLDYETARIDELIAKQERLIELLKEKRQAVISHAVTKGLDPDVKMKDSGVEWLGEVPEHWTLPKFKYLASIKNGRDYKDVEDLEGDIPVIGSGGAFAKSSKHLFSGESVLLGRKGTIDRPLYVNCKFWTVDTMFYTEVKRSTCAKFLYYSALTIPFKLYSTNTALPSMTQEDLGNHSLSYPPLTEQHEIANFLDHAVSKVDALVDKQAQMKLLLKERRTALISAAVTGKIDVRNWQPPKQSQSASPQDTPSPAEAVV